MDVLYVSIMCSLMVILIPSTIILALGRDHLGSIPGPIFARYTWCWEAFTAFRGDLPQTLRRYHAKFGPLIRIAPNRVSVSRFSDLIKIYNLKGTFRKDEFYTAFEPRLSPVPVAFAMQDEAQHTPMRRALNVVYGVDSLRRREDIFDTILAEFMVKLQYFAENDQAIDLAEWFQRLVMLFAYI